MSADPVIERGGGGLLEGGGDGKLLQESHLLGKPKIFAGMSLSEAGAKEGGGGENLLLQQIQIMRLVFPKLLNCSLEQLVVSLEHAEEENKRACTCDSHMTPPTTHPVRLLQLLSTVFQPHSWRPYSSVTRSHTLPSSIEYSHICYN